MSIRLRLVPISEKSSKTGSANVPDRSGWIDARDPNTKIRRLDSKSDFVRIEIGEALARGIPVVPVILDWASKLCNVPRKSYSLGYEVGYKDFQRIQEILR
jgi:hypothetical protein